MASTIADSTLTVTVTEEIKINGIANNSENKYMFDRIFSRNHLREFPAESMVPIEYQVFGMQ